MKTLLTTVLFLITFLTHAQNQKPVEVLMIGTSHTYNMTYPEDFKGVIQKALRFRPDAVFGETLSPADYDALTDYWNKATMEKRFAYLKSLNYPAPANPDKFIRQTTNLLRKHPNYHQDRMKLARALYLKHDYGNARYQLYRLDKARHNFGPEEVSAYRTILGVPDSLYRSRNNEYHNMAFPLVDSLGYNQILSMDSQRHDLKWQTAWDAADPLYKKWETGLENDTNNVDTRRYIDLMRRMDTLQKAESKAEKEGRGTAYLNSPDGDEFLNIVNFYGARRLFGCKNFPEKEVAAMLAEWQNRNDDMVRNTVERARKAGVSRVVVFVGANHRKIMVDGFRATPGVTVHELNSF